MYIKIRATLGYLRQGLLNVFVSFFQLADADTYSMSERLFNIFTNNRKCRVSKNYLRQNSSLFLALTLIFSEQ